MSSHAPTALVTGANRGLGLEVTRQLMQAGYHVALGARDPEQGEAAAARLRGEKTPGRVFAVALDVDDQASITAAREVVEREFDALDALVNNAAILYDDWARAINADLDEVRAAYETNTMGPWRVTQTFLPLLRRSRAPRIVNVSSGAGALDGMGGGTPAYGVSKAALNALTLKLAAELKNEDFLVNAVCPGWTATDMGGGGRPIPDGARGITWAATLPKGGPTGGFFRDGKQIAW
jgi:NAD(P)-dependent dehydrogenase (short-subunit alcohol dehydrogenase family)